VDLPNRIPLSLIHYNGTAIHWTSCVRAELDERDATSANTWNGTWRIRIRIRLRLSRYANYFAFRSNGGISHALPGELLHSSGGKILLSIMIYLQRGQTVQHTHVIPAKAAITYLLVGLFVITYRERYFTIKDSKRIYYWSPIDIVCIWEERRRERKEERWTCWNDMDRWKTSRF